MPPSKMRPLSSAASSRKLSSLCIVLLSSLLAACGGGGSDTAQAENKTSGNGSTGQPSQPYDPILPTQTAENYTARFTRLTDIDVDRTGNIFVVDDGDIRKMAMDGTVTTVYSHPSDEILPSDSSTKITRIALDPQGNFVATAGFAVKRITADGAMMNVMDDVRSANCPEVDYPASGIAVDQSGNIYLSYNREYEVRMISPSGEMREILRGEMDDGCQPVDYGGPRPLAFALDDADALYVANSIMIWKITEGQTTPVMDREGRNLIYSPYGITIDQEGTIYVGSYMQGGGAAGGYMRNYISKVNPDGSVAFVAGKAHNSRESEFLDGPANEAKFAASTLLAASPDGNLYVADSPNHAIRRVAPDGYVTTIAGSRPGDAN